MVRVYKNIILHGKTKPVKSRILPKNIVEIL